MGPPGLVERRVRDVGLAVAIPAPVGPLCLDQRFGEHVEPGVRSQADVDTGLQRTALLRGTTSNTARDAPLVDHSKAGRARDPVERLLRGHNRSCMLGPHPEIGEREESPERSAPLRIRMDAVVLRERGDERFTHVPKRRGQVRALESGRRRRARRPATGPRAAGGSRRGPRDRTTARRSSRLRSRAPTRACSRA